MFLDTPLLIATSSYLKFVTLLLPSPSFPSKIRLLPSLIPRESKEARTYCLFRTTLRKEMPREVRVKALNLIKHDLITHYIRPTGLHHCVPTLSSLRSS